MPLTESIFAKNWWLTPWSLLSCSEVHAAVHMFIVRCSSDRQGKLRIHSIWTNTNVVPPVNRVSAGGSMRLSSCRTFAFWVWAFFSLCFVLILGWCGWCSSSKVATERHKCDPTATSWFALFSSFSARDFKLHVTIKTSQTQTLQRDRSIISFCKFCNASGKFCNCPSQPVAQSNLLMPRRTITSRLFIDKKKQSNRTWISSKHTCSWAKWRTPKIK